MLLHYFCTILLQCVLLRMPQKIICRCHEVWVGDSFSYKIAIMIPGVVSWCWILGLVMSYGSILCTLELRVITLRSIQSTTYKIPRNVVKFRLTLLWFTDLQLSVESVVSNLLWEERFNQMISRGPFQSLPFHSMGAITIISTFPTETELNKFSKSWVEWVFAFA